MTFHPRANQRLFGPDGGHRLALHIGSHECPVCIIVIEESYVSRNLPEHTDLANQGFLVRSGCEACAPVYLDNNSTGTTLTQGRGACPECGAPFAKMI